jgi:predicted HicB family RNase H-like nuclease
VRPSVKDRAEKWAERHGQSLSAYVLSALQSRMDRDLLDDIKATTDPDD